MLGRFLALLYLCLIWVSASHAVDYWVLTDFGSSAEMMSIGNVEGFGHSANAVFENPASMGCVQSSSISAFTTTILGSVTYTNVAFASKFSFGTIGVGYMDASVGGIPHTAVANDSRETFYQLYGFDYKSSVMKLAYQTDLSSEWSFGSALTFYRSVFDDVVGNGANVDVGALWSRGPLSMSFSARNLLPGGRVDYGRDSQGRATFETLPLQLTAGAAYAIDAFDVYGQLKESSSHTMVSGGVKYHVLKLPLEFSVGYKQFQVLDSVDDSVAFGTGLILGDVSVHYSFEKSSHPDFDNQSYFSMAVNL